jgi:hypothetical protein
MEEGRKNTVTMIFTIVGGLASAGSLAASLLISATGSTPALRTSAASSNGSWSGYLLFLSALLGAGICCASAANMLLRRYAFPAFLVSILLACGVTFVATLSAVSLGVDFGRTREGASALAQIIYWATVFIFACVNAPRALDTFLAWIARYLSAEGLAKGDAFGVLGALLLLLLCWLGAVSAGQDWLTMRLLSQH